MPDSFSLNDQIMIAWVVIIVGGICAAAIYRARPRAPVDPSTGSLCSGDN